MAKQTISIPGAASFKAASAKPSLLEAEKQGAVTAAELMALREQVRRPCTGRVRRAGAAVPRQRAADRHAV